MKTPNNNPRPFVVKSDIGLLHITPDAFGDSLKVERADGGCFKAGKTCFKTALICGLDTETPSAIGFSCRHAHLGTAFSGHKTVRAIIAVAKAWISKDANRRRYVTACLRLREKAQLKQLKDIAHEAWKLNGLLADTRIALERGETSLSVLSAA
jgi:hypothetical protein